MERDNILKDIFFARNMHWDKFIGKYEKRIRSIVLKEVDKFRHCGQKEAGFTLFACPVCGEMKIVPHTCKGRFCTSVLQDTLRNGAGKPVSECIGFRIDI